MTKKESIWVIFCVVLVTVAAGFTVKWTKDCVSRKKPTLRDFMATMGGAWK